MAHQIGGVDGIGVDHNPLPPDGGIQALPPPPPAADRISSLSENARRRIVSFVPFKTALALGIISNRWMGVVKKACRLRDGVLGIHILSAPGPPCPLGCVLEIHLPSVQVRVLANKLDERGRGPDHRLTRLFLYVDDARMSPDGFAFLLDYATDCEVEAVTVDARRVPAVFSYSFQRASHRLVHLWLRGVRVDGIFRPEHPELRFNPTLEIIRIHSTDLDDDDLAWMLLSCPHLRLLDLRRCRGITSVSVTVGNAPLVSLTVAECPEVTSIMVATSIGLRSFHYRGDYLRIVTLPRTCFGDLYISFPRPGVGVPLYSWIDALPNLSNLTVLTLCSNALRIVSILSSRESLQPKLAKLSNLQNLRELQLLMYAMGTVMLSDIYGFLRICRCSQLRKLFVELPKFRMDSFTDAVSDLAEEPMDVFENLVMAKITNFKWQCNEIELVHFLFRKASSLQKLTLVAPPETLPERDQSGKPFFQDAKLVRMEKAPSNAQVTIVSAHHGAKFQAFHQYVNLEC